MGRSSLSFLKFPVLKFLQLCQFPLFLFKNGKLSKYSGSFLSFDDVEWEVGFCLP